MLSLTQYKDCNVHLKNIETYIDKVLAGKATFRGPVVCRELMACYKNALHFDMEVVQMELHEKSFIMCISPDIEELERLIHPIVTALNNAKNNIPEVQREWGKIREWHIEMDSRLLDKRSNLCVDNGGEFVAILCHELGHVADNHPINMALAYSAKKARLSTYEKILSGKPSASVLFIPMIVAGSAFRIVVGKPINDISEFSADSHIPEDYKPYMVSYVDHHILTSPEAREVIITEDDMINEESVGAMFTTDCLKLMTKRRNTLARQIENQYKMSNSNYIKKACSKVINRISGKNIQTGKMDLYKDKYIETKMERDEQEAMAESIVVLESFRDINTRDIYLLKSECDAIETRSDKSFCLNLIFDYIEKLRHIREKKIQKYGSPTTSDGKSITPVEDEKLQLLDDILKSVNEKEIALGWKGRGVYVNYPKGYEG